MAVHTPEWWREKIEGNRARDAQVHARLKAGGWRQAHVWECALKGRERRDPDTVIEELADWLDSNRNELEIRGTAA
jgi:DNA mismatch endonuclease (patch repair protein)